MIKAILNLFQKKKPPIDPLALAQAKRALEKKLRLEGVSCKEAKRRVYVAFSGSGRRS